MSTKETHLEYLKQNGSYNIDCDTKVFSQEEIEIIEKYGHWFKALSDGTLEPINKEQQDFIDVSHGLREPSSAEEKAWFKYLGRKMVENKYGDKLHVQHTPDNDSFYSREMIKKNRKTMFKVINESHKK